MADIAVALAEAIGHTRFSLPPRTRINEKFFVTSDWVPMNELDDLEDATRYAALYELEKHACLITQLDVLATLDRIPHKCFKNVCINAMISEYLTVQRPVYLYLERGFIAHMKTLEQLSYEEWGSEVSDSGPALEAIASV